MTYLELAEEQFRKLKEDTLDENRHDIGAENEQDYDNDLGKFTIKVVGFWEKSTWFEWVAADGNGKQLDSGASY